MIPDMTLEQALARAKAAETERDKWRNLVRRLWFFFASVIPSEWIDETIDLLMKRANKGQNATRKN